LYVCFGMFKGLKLFSAFFERAYYRRRKMYSITVGHKTVLVVCLYVFIVVLKAWIQKAIGNDI